MSNTIMNTTKKIGDAGTIELFQSNDVSFIDSSKGNIVIGRFFTCLSKEGQSILFNEHLRKLRNEKHTLPNSIVAKAKINVIKEMYTFLLNLVSTDEKENNNLNIHDEMKLISSEYIELKKVAN